MSDAPSMIVADIGNSALKLARATITERGEAQLKEAFRLPHGAVDDASLAAWAPQETQRWFIASVHQEKLHALTSWVEKHRPDHSVCKLTCFDLDLQISVDAPRKVGIDRLLSAVAANRRRSPQRAALTITAGTAVTINAIDAKGTFLGGAILPGATLMATSLHEHTDALPLVEQLASPTSPIGKNTESAIRSGIQFGLLGAVRELVAQVERQLGAEVEVFFAGGDAEGLQAGLGRGVLAPDLVLEGAAITGQRLLSKS